jgi:hypothetical protein
MYLLWGWSTHPQLVGNWGQKDLKHNDVECATQKAEWFKTTFTRQRKCSSFGNKTKKKTMYD